jgi:hypothetical protein
MVQPKEELPRLPKLKARPAAVRRAAGRPLARVPAAVTRVSCAHLYSHFKAFDSCRGRSRGSGPRPHHSWLFRAPQAHIVALENEYAVSPKSPLLSTTVQKNAWVCGAWPPCALGAARRGTLHGALMGHLVGVRSDSAALIAGQQEKQQPVATRGLRGARAAMRAPVPGGCGIQHARRRRLDDAALGIAGTNPHPPPQATTRAASWAWSASRSMCPRRFRRARGRGNAGRIWGMPLRQGPHAVRAPTQPRSAPRPEPCEKRAASRGRTEREGALPLAVCGR